MLSIFSEYFAFYVSMPVAACVARSASMRVLWTRLVDANLLNKPLSLAMWYLVSIFLSSILILIPIAFGTLGVVAQTVVAHSKQEGTLWFNLFGLVPLFGWLGIEHTIISRRKDPIAVALFWTKMFKIGITVSIEFAVAFLVLFALSFLGQNAS